MYYKLEITEKGGLNQELKNITAEVVVYTLATALRDIKEKAGATDAEILDLFLLAYKTAVKEREK